MHILLTGDHKFCAQPIKLLSATFCPSPSSERDKTERVKPY